MKFCESWLREFANPSLDTNALAHALTMAGLEIEAVEPAANDTLLTIKLTPNRSDCLGLLGIAREVAAITNCTLHTPQINAIPGDAQSLQAIEIVAAAACPRYSGRIIRNINLRAVTPKWMEERLIGSGLHGINPIVDITNYVMLELGQPLHAFDLASIVGEVQVRYAAQGERLKLLNQALMPLTDDMLIIADEEKPLALAGIMGGEESAVSANTTDIFLESAFFEPAVIMGKARQLGFSTDASYRFERGVDFALTRKALERATQLIMQICGGIPGEVSERCDRLPERVPVLLRVARVNKLLGLALEPAQITTLFQRLQFDFKLVNQDFYVTPPSYRFDIAIEEDLIEEIARIHGYEAIPVQVPLSTLSLLPYPGSERPLNEVKLRLATRDYQEVINYAFVSKAWEEDFVDNANTIALVNPIASHMSVMRSSLLGGLIQCLQHNLSRQQARVRVFEVGACFNREPDGSYQQPEKLAGLIYGNRMPEHWDVTTNQVDFYDAKADIEALFFPHSLMFEKNKHPAFHPGRSAAILYEGMCIGSLGELHPKWQQKYDLPLPPVLFEVLSAPLLIRQLPRYEEISKFPIVRRDIALLVDEAIEAGLLLQLIFTHKPAIVKEVSIFDVYRGKGVETGEKSLAFRVLLQDTQKTLTDEEVEQAVTELIKVTKECGAKLRI